jgi:transcriptional regulator with XRE-family HTH domain
MGIDDKYLMKKLPAFIRSMREKEGIGYEKIASRSDGLKHSVVRSIEQGVQKKHGFEPPNPKILTLKKLAPGLGIDYHEMAHLAFDLPPPADLGELDETLRELCDLAMRLSGEEREMLLEKVRAYLEARESLFGMELGGDANRAQQTRPAKKAGHG